MRFRAPRGITRAIGGVLALLAVIGFGVVPTATELRALVPPWSLPLYLGALLLVAWWPTMVMAQTAWEVEVRDAELVVRWQRPWATGESRVRFGDLRELFAVRVAPDAWAVVAVCAEREVLFGAGLSLDEARRLIEAIRGDLATASETAEV
jgi:hypothetical protein